MSVKAVVIRVAWSMVEEWVKREREEEESMGAVVRKMERKYE